MEVTPPPFQTVQEVEPGSYWSNLAQDGERFKNLSQDKPFETSPGFLFKWMKHRYTSGEPSHEPPRNGFEAFGRQWFQPCDMGADVAAWRASGEPTALGDRLYWIGHASQLLCLSTGLNILLDPIFSARASPVSFAGPKRRFAAATTVAQLPPIHVVLISHNHYDHLDKASVQQVARRFPQARFVVPLKMDRFLLSWGVPAACITVLNWWEEARLGSGARVACTPAHHWGKHSLGDDNKALWCGWCVGWSLKETDEPAPGGVANLVSTKAEWGGLKKFYFTGDTAYHSSVTFDAIYQAYGAMDMAALPIGAYSPRKFLSKQHIDPAQAVQVFKDVHAAKAMAVHWGTFQLGDERFDEPPELLNAALDESSIDKDRFRAIPLGGHVDF